MGLELELTDQSVSDAERVILHNTILACVNTFDRRYLPKKAKIDGQSDQKSENSGVRSI